MKPVKITIRLKLLLLSIAVLSIPYFGFEYVRELERYLQDALELSLVDAARAVAGPLQEQAALFPEVDSDERALYSHDFIHPILLDGFDDDWLAYLSWSDTYTETSQGPRNRDDKLSFRIIVGHYQQYINVLLQVDDRQVIFQKPGAATAIDNDHIVLVYDNAVGEMEHFYFSPAAPGSIRPFQYRKNKDEFNIEYESAEYANNINAEFQPTASGYNLEILIPSGLVGGRLGFVVADVDDIKRRQEAARAETAGVNTLQKPGRLVQSSPLIKRIIQPLASAEGRRIWVLDKQGQVLSSSGGLNRKASVDTTNVLYSLLLPSVNERFSDDLNGASRLQGSEVLQALQGQSTTNWRSSPGQQAVIISAASPVWVNGVVRGVIVVEETTNSIQMVQRHAMKSLFDKSIFVFITVTLLLLGFASRLSFRLRRLSQEAESAIDEHGRVVADFNASKATDEIGELSRNYAAMLDRLKQYNQYLEGMSGRLSHELRTPITVVQSSLDHLQANLAAHDRDRYLQRAREGVERLNLIVIRLSEATRLEQALQSAQKKQTDLRALLLNCTEGYRLAYPQVVFKLLVPESPVMYLLAADLIVQMLDKLIDNAVDFSEPGKPVEIELASGAGQWQLQIRNYGPRLPDTMEDQIFNSMVSIRNKKDRGKPHLGLGLYIVRLIAEYHGAAVRARTDEAAGSVTFIVEFQK
ncbi:MAG: sensor signal transduction histidine kinase [Gammaproteobacteria bacterium]|nr:sensor signal transduction histidine kinase [Gammaproteobacteria bacterium]